MGSVSLLSPHTASSFHNDIVDGDNDDDIDNADGDDDFNRAL